MARALDGRAFIRHIIYTVAGTGVGETVGYPYDSARWSNPDLFEVVPIRYPAKAVPMNGSVDKGVAELVRLMELNFGRTFALDGYSQGAIVTSIVLQRMMTGDLKKHYPFFIGGVTFGNPMREAGHTFPGGKDPGGRGVSDIRLVNTPDSYWDFANPGDIYTVTPLGDAGEMQTAIYMAVMSQFFKGEDSLFSQVKELIKSPLKETLAAVVAIWNGIKFISGPIPTGPHVEYHVREVAPGVTGFDMAIRHLNDIGARNIARAA